jgi:hypothetical protein
MKKIILFISVIIVLYSCSRIFSGSNSEKGVVYAVTVVSQDDGIIKAAKEGLDKFIPMIPSGFENLYGFESRDDFQTASVGKPYEVYSLSTEFLNSENSDIKNYLYQVGEWRVPVLVAGKNCCLLTVVKKNDQYTCVDLGGAELANELNNYEKFFNNEIQKRVILRLYQINCDFLVLAPKNVSISTGDYYALSSSKISLEKYQVLKDGAYKFDELSSVIKMKYSEEYNTKN